MIDPASRTLAAVVFDLDGTLIDSSRIKLDAYFQAMRQHAGGESSDHLRAYARYGTLNRGEQLAAAFLDVTGRRPSAGEQADLVATYGDTCRRRQGEVRVFDGFEALVTRLSGYWLAVASNAPQDEVVETCEALKIRDHFRQIYGFPTTKVEALQNVSLRVQAEVSQILYVGDRPEDRAAAKSAGALFRLIDHTGRAPYGSEDLVSSFQYLGDVVKHLGRWRPT